MIRDFPGNYSQYRDWREKEDASIKASSNNTITPSNIPIAETPTKTKLSYKEKFELENIEKELPALQEEKKQLEEKMNNGGISFDELNKCAQRISEIIVLLDEKELRWLELSEKV